MAMPDSSAPHPKPHLLVVRRVVPLFAVGLGISGAELLLLEDGRGASILPSWGTQFILLEALAGAFVMAGFVETLRHFFATRPR